MSVILYCLGICKLVQKPVHGFSVRKHTFRNSQKHIVFFLQQAFPKSKPWEFQPDMYTRNTESCFCHFTTQVSFFHLVCPGFQESQPAALPIQKNTRNSQYSACKKTPAEHSSPRYPSPFPMTAISIPSPTPAKRSIPNTATASFCDHIPFTVTFTQYSANSPFGHLEFQFCFNLLSFHLFPLFLCHAFGFQLMLSSIVPCNGKKTPALSAGAFHPFISYT